MKCKLCEHPVENHEHKGCRCICNPCNIEECECKGYITKNGKTVRGWPVG